MADKKVIIEGSDITARQMKEFWGQAALGLVNRKNFQEYLELQKTAGNDYLRCVSSGKDPIIPACDGSRIIAEAKDIFGYIDIDFRGWKADEKGVATSETPASVFELKQNATFGQMFEINVSNLTNTNSSDAKRLRQMIYTQDQIIGFVENHRSWLRTDGYATFFLFESYGNFFVAHVRFGAVG